MRLSILAFPTCTGLSAVHGTIATTESLRTDLADRVYNGDSFPGEHIVRLPRRLCRSIRSWARHSYRSIDITRTLKHGRALFYGEALDYANARKLSTEGK